MAFFDRDDFKCLKKTKGYIVKTVLIIILPGNKNFPTAANCGELNLCTCLLLLYTGLKEAHVNITKKEEGIHNLLIHFFHKMIY